MAHAKTWLEQRLNKRARRNKAIRQAKYSKPKDEKVAGWEQFQNVESRNITEGIVAGKQAGKALILIGDELVDTVFHKTVPRELYKTLAVGDFVKIERTNDGNFIRYRLNRRSFLARSRGDASRISAFAQEEQVIAANVDTAVIVVSIKEPNFHPRLIDRYLIVCQHGNITPLICLNKCDLTGERHPILKWYQENLDIETVETSTVTREGLEKLREALADKICVFVGHSGVGKSSLINLLKEDLDIKTTSVSSKTGKGRHTTTSSNLYQIAPETYVIDTPGIRALGLPDIDRKDLKNFFPEFEEHQQDCRYSNCIHAQEEGCAVRQAAEIGSINPHRYGSYMRILKELG